MSKTAAPLRLIAQDAEDLAVISAALQDAVGRIGDIQWQPAAKRLTLALNRFRWETAAGKRGERVRAGLQLSSVTAVQSRNLRRDFKDGVVELLAVTFETGPEAPGGTVVLKFAGDGDMRAEVECIDAVLADVSAPWPTRNRPAHAD